MYKNNINDPEAQKNINSEIKRYDIINYLIEKYNLVNYLEIGVFNGENIRRVKAEHKDGVDPGHEGIVAPEVTYPMISDDFFKLIEDHDDIKYDIIFIDGLHHADQVSKDIQNSLKHLTSTGFIVMHDCNPISFEAQKIPRETTVWNGDTWIAFVDFKDHHPGYKCCVVDTDFGIGVIQNSKDNMSYMHKTLWNWEYFYKHKKQLLNLISFDEFKTIF
jgi:hypothetical protein